MQDLNIKEQIEGSKLPQDAIKALQILDDIEGFTAQLRKKLMAEIRPGGNVVRLQLEEV